MKITIIFLDGYKGWNVSRTHQVEIEGPFNETTCRDALAKAEDMDDEESKGTLEEMYGSRPVIKGTVLTCIGEEGGVVFVA